MAFARNVVNGRQLPKTFEVKKTIQRRLNIGKSKKDAAARLFKLTIRSSLEKKDQVPQIFFIKKKKWYRIYANKINGLGCVAKWSLKANLQQ